MSAPLYVSTPDEPLRAAVEVPLRASRDRGGWTSAAPDPLRDRCAQVDGNAGRNGRVGRALPQGLWHRRARLALDPDIAPAHLLSDGADRAALLGRRHWLLADLRGARIARGPLGPETAAVDVARGVLWVPALSGLVDGIALADGAARWAELVRGAAGMSRALSLTADGALCVHTRETRWQPHGGALPPSASLELRDLGAPVTAEPDGFVTSSRRRAAVCRDADRLLVAEGAPGELVVATEHSLWWLDGELAALSRVVGEFIPIWLSADESSRAYVVAQTAEGISLRVVTADGRMVLDAPVPDGLGDVLAPPVVAHDHRVHLLCENGLFTAGPADLPAWTPPSLRAPPRGARVTGDDHLVLTVGDGLVMVSPQGRVLREQRFDGDALCTAPALTLGGELLVASATALYVLEPL